MNKIIKSLIFLLVALVGFTACSKKLGPTKTDLKLVRNYDKDNYGLLFVEAIKQKLLGNESDALMYLEQCIKMNPESDGAYYQMAQIVSSNGDGKNGKLLIARALEIDQDNMWYLMMLAGLYYQEGKRDSAIIYYEKAAKYFPDRENILSTLGNLYIENKDFEKATNVFNILSDKYGVNEKTTPTEIKGLMMAKRYDEALALVQLLIEEYPQEITYRGLLAEIYKAKGDGVKAKEVYQKLMEENPDNPQTQLSLCDFLLKEKNYDDLFLLLNSAILNNNINKNDKILLIAEILENEDIVINRSDNMMLSIMILEANYKNDDIFILFRPELLIKQKKYEEASTRLEEILKLSPKNYYAWEKLIFTYLQMKDFVKVMNRGEEFATLFNRSFVAKILYANGAMENEKYVIALDEVRKAEILAGDNKGLIIQVLTMRADIYYRMKEYTKAFEVFDKAISSDKEDLTVLNNYAYYLAEQNMRLKEAENMSKIVVEKQKGNTTYLDTYAWVLYKRKKLNEAAKVMEEIINSKEQADAVWYEHYGFILKDQKKCMKAIEYWNMAIKLDAKKSYLIKDIEKCEK